jgi:nucleoside-diphosphate-sugar epimerase
MNELRIAILGSNSHIAKGLIYNFLSKSQAALFLYTRNVSELADFLHDSVNVSDDRYAVIEGYHGFLNCGYDVIINCIGAGAPNKLGNDFSRWFTLTEEYDNLCIEYLHRHAGTLYLNFSSGGVYGSNGTMPATENTVNCIKVNHVQPADYYSIVRLNSEAKHRAFSDLRIVDLRIFAYFSRFIDLNSGYFMTELLNALINCQTFKTNAINIVRDYIHPGDLFRLIQLCIKSDRINAAFDVISAGTVEKVQIIEYFAANYNLRYEVDGEMQINSPNGTKNIYCSNYNRAADIGYRPEFSSMATIEQEAAHILKK